MRSYTKEQYDTAMEMVAAAEKAGRSHIDIAKELGIPRTTLATWRLYDVKPTVSQIASPTNILLLDIETAPMEVFVYHLWKQWISPDKVIKDWSILTWAAKWLGSGEMISGRVYGTEAYLRDDTRILKGIWNLLDKANIVIAHNGRKFDLPRLDTRFLLTGYEPPSSYRDIDTLQVVRRRFKFSSNKLDYINGILGIQQKSATDFDLWRRCVSNKREAVKALKYMDKYCQTDVLALEDLYYTLRPWILSHPNVGTYIGADENRCPNCGSDQLTFEGNYYYTPAGKFKAYRCECGAPGRSGSNELILEKRKKLLRSLAR